MTYIYTIAVFFVISSNAFYMYRILVSFKGLNRNEIFGDACF